MPTRQRNYVSSDSYSAIAQRLGLQLCGCGSDYPKVIGDHRMGWTAYRMTEIHWKDRRVTRRGLYRFLKLVAETQLDLAGSQRFERIYALSIRAFELGLKLGVRFPREFSADDRAMVRLGMAVWRRRTNRQPVKQHRRIAAWSRP